MGIYFCDNPLCPQHVTWNTKLGCLRVRKPNGFVASRGDSIAEEVITYYRHEYISYDGKSLHYFCDVCHKSIQMVRTN